MKTISKITCLHREKLQKNTQINILKKLTYKINLKIDRNFIEINKNLLSAEILISQIVTQNINYYIPIYLQQAIRKRCSNTIY